MSSDCLAQEGGNLSDKFTGQRDKREKRKGDGEVE
jgi:hypothetical protein